MLDFIKFKGNLNMRKSLLYVSSPRERNASSFPEKRLVTEPTSFPGLFSFHFLKEELGDCAQGTGRDEVVIDKISTFLIGSISRLILHNQLPLTKHFTYYF